ncbi:MAG: hypothetical protein FJ215_08085 [Ignavibacteria bacterium]|nr:hypothetical protein [Ignavibacteria bacterium]
MSKKMKLGARIANVLVEPSEAFNDIFDASAKTRVWLYPLVLSLLLVPVWNYVILNDELLSKQVYELRQKQFRTTAGTMRGMNDGSATSEESTTRLRFRRLFVMFSILGISKEIVYFFGAVFFLSLFGRVFLHIKTTFHDSFALYGLSMWIDILGSIIALLMVKAFGSLSAKPTAAALFFSTYDPSITIHRILTEFNFFSVWQSSVIGIGLAKLSGKKRLVAVSLVVSGWALWVLISAKLRITTITAP